MSIPPPLVPSAPTSARQRIVSMDVLRGFALLGIFLMNIEAMSGPLGEAMSGIGTQWQGVDRIADALIYIFVQGKFYTLFSLLFGMGFVLFMDRARAAGRGGWLFVRRLAVLLAFGVLHGVFIWAGDILSAYALVGVALLLFANVSVRWLWWIGLGLFVLMPGFLLVMAAGMAMLGDAGQSLAASTAHMLQEMDEAQRLAYGSGSYLQAMARRGFDFAMSVGNLLSFGVLLLGIFVIGAALQRGGVTAEPGRHRRLLQGLLWIGLPLGLLLMLVSVWVSPQSGNPMVPAQAAAMGLLMLAQLPMALGYMAAVLLAMDSVAGRRALGWLAPVGRMALSNYLLQSIIATTVFYGYGLGWFDQVGRVQQVLFVLLVFAGQVLLSHLWLARFRYGPAEWLWRWATYGSRPPLRHAS